MNTRTIMNGTLLGAALLSAPAFAVDVGTAFTYQGRLTEDGAQANGTFAIDFSLWDAAAGGSQVGTTVPLDVEVADGLFTVELDFGADPFADLDGPSFRGARARWLEIAVESVALSPRQRLTPAPFALNTRNFLVDDDNNITVGNFGTDPTGSMTLTSKAGIELVIDADTNNQGGEDQNARLVLCQDGRQVAARVGFENNNHLVIMQGADAPLRLGTNDTERMRITSAGRVGIGMVSPQFLLDVAGTARVDVLRIAGADVAERFPSREDVEPGTVMVIDTARPGALRRSQVAYDRHVAGVVSGAGDLPAGAILGHRPGSEDDAAIALSGRVWVRCDASAHPIRPGDLLTTSSVAGHAMAVVDRDRAAGAILGKAMTPLESGRGLVLVLVSLQ